MECLNYSICIFVSVLVSLSVSAVTFMLLLCPILYLLIEFACLQIQVSYYPPGQYPSSGQQYRVPQSMSHQVSYPAQRTQPIPQPTQQAGQYSVFWCSDLRCKLTLDLGKE